MKSANLIRHRNNHAGEIFFSYYKEVGLVNKWKTYKEMFAQSKLSVRVVMMEKWTNMMRVQWRWPAPQSPFADAHSSVAEGSGLFFFPKKKPHNFVYIEYTFSLNM